MTAAPYIASGPDDPEVPEGALRAFDLTGRVAVITGAAGGLGRACAEMLALAGARVVCADVQPSDRTVQIVAARGGSASGAIVDVTDREAVEALADEVVARHGRLDVMVNNAAINLRAAAMDASEEDWDRTLAVDVKGVAFGVRAAGRVMRARGGGSIVNVASEAIDLNNSEVLTYGAAKAAVRQLTRAFAAELGPHGVRVNAVAPGWMLTPLTRTLNATGEMLAERMAARREQSVLKRHGSTADVAYGVLYLASDASSWTTGQCLRISGGRTMTW